MTQSNTMIVVTVALFMAALAVVSASKPADAGLEKEIRALCTGACKKEHMDPAESAQCADFCVLANKYFIEAYEKETAPMMRVSKFKALCGEGCGKEYKDPAVITKCMAYCVIEAKDLEKAFAEDKVV